MAERIVLLPHGPPWTTVGRLRNMVETTPTPCVQVSLFRCRCGVGHSWRAPRLRVLESWSQGGHQAVPSLELVSLRRQRTTHAMMRGSLCVCPVLSAFLEDLQFWAVKSAGFDLHPEGSGAFLSRS